MTSFCRSKERATLPAIPSSVPRASRVPRSSLCHCLRCWAWILCASRRRPAVPPEPCCPSAPAMAARPASSAIVPNGPPNAWMARSRSCTTASAARGATSHAAPRRSASARTRRAIHRPSVRRDSISTRGPTCAVPLVRRAEHAEPLRTVAPTARCRSCTPTSAALAATIGTGRGRQPLECRSRSRFWWPFRFS